MGMTREQGQQVLAAVFSAVKDGELERAWAEARPLLDSWRDDVEAARWTCALATAPELEFERRSALAEALLEAYALDALVPVLLGNEAVQFIDVRFLNASAPVGGPLARLLQVLAAQLEVTTSDAQRVRVAGALAQVAFRLGRDADALCERMHRLLLELEPSRWQRAYDYGLFLKNRGRFEEGVVANQRAATLGGADDESVSWNLGICATGAGQGALALEVWRRACAFKGALGADGLPDGRFHAVKVQVVQRPLASRSARDDTPGDAETLWVDRLSPCHGRVLSPPLADVGVEYGDLVLFDGAPITTHSVNGREVPVFPQLTTLRRGGWRVFPFAGTQPESGAIRRLSEVLPGDSVVYPHTESVCFFCQDCWEKGALSGHDHGDRGTATTVRGKLCIDPSVVLEDADDALRRALKASPHLQFVAPALALALGKDHRAKAEAKTFDALCAALAEG